jgi:hypothetical protein
MIAELTHNAWHKMRAYVDNCPDEISGLGKVEIVDGNFLVTDIAIFEQVVSAAHSDIPAAALAKFQVELIKKGENPKDWFCWWHSHAAMKTFLSGRDTATIDESTDFKMMLSIVTNHAHEFTSRFDLYSPVRMKQDVQVQVLEEEDDDIINECKAEIAKKVSKPAPSAYLGYGRGGDHSHNHGKTHNFGFEKKEEHEKLKTLSMPTKTRLDFDVMVDLEQYNDEVAGLVEEIANAHAAGDMTLVKMLRDELEDKKIDGFYAGYEKSYPKKLS